MRRRLLDTYYFVGLYALLSVAILCMSSGCTKKHVACAPSEEQTSEKQSRTPAAVTAKGAEEDKIDIVPVNLDFPAEKMKSATYRIHTLSDRDFARTQPKALDRDQIIKKAGLHTFVGSLDHMGRDLLLIQAREWSVDQLKKEYPKMPENGLRTLRKLASEWGGQK